MVLFAIERDTFYGHICTYINPVITAIHERNVALIGRPFNALLHIHYELWIYVDLSYWPV